MLLYRIFTFRFSFWVLFDEFYLDNYYFLMTILHVDFYKDIFRAYLHSKFTDSAGGHQSLVFLKNSMMAKQQFFPIIGTQLGLIKFMTDFKNSLKIYS